MRDDSGWVNDATFGVRRQSEATTALSLSSIEFAPKRCRAALATALQICRPLRGLEFFGDVIPGVTLAALAHPGLLSCRRSAGRLGVMQKPRAVASGC